MCLLYGPVSSAKASTASETSSSKSSGITTGAPGSAGCAVPTAIKMWFRMVNANFGSEVDTLLTRESTACGVATSALLSISSITASKRVAASVRSSVIPSSVEMTPARLGG